MHRSDKVLVLEDEALIAMTLRDEMHELGYDCVVAGTLDQARAELSNWSPGFAIVDSLIGQQTSDEILSELNQRGIPVIICSALSEQELGMGRTHAVFLAKPYTRASLEGALAQVIDYV